MEVMSDDYLPVQVSIDHAAFQDPEPKLPFLQMMFMDMTMRLVIVCALPEEVKQQAISDIDEKLRNDKLKHRVAHVLPLAEVADAHEIIEQGDCRGCVLVTMN